MVLIITCPELLKSFTELKTWSHGEGGQTAKDVQVLILLEIIVEYAPLLNSVTSNDEN
jgi:hypothetical protein